MFDSSHLILVLKTGGVEGTSTPT